jgi:hypothetical protein
LINSFHSSDCSNTSSILQQAGATITYLVFAHAEQATIRK